MLSVPDPAIRISDIGCASSFGSVRLVGRLQMVNVFRAPGVRGDRLLVTRDMHQSIELPSASSARTDLAELHLRRDFGRHERRAAIRIDDLPRNPTGLLRAEHRNHVTNILGRA
jgi:hypothetical protein